jgi:hypothetical protein
LKRSKGRIENWPNGGPGDPPPFEKFTIAALAPAAPLRAQMEHVLFITNVPFNINAGAEPDPAGNQFGGLSSADFLCTQRASLAEFIHGWDGQILRALISTSLENANARMGHW